MKKLVSLFATASLIVSGMLYADVFASRIKFTNPDGNPFDGKVNDGTGVKVWYYLNDTATAVVVKIINASTNQVVATVNAGAQGRFSNPNSITWDGTGGAANTKYYATFTTTGLVYSSTRFHSFYFQSTADVPPLIGRGIYTRGVDANTDMNSSNFGYWYASCTDAASNEGYKQGTLRYNPDGSFAGTDPDHPMLTQTLGTANGGTYDWGGATTWTAALDYKGRLYQSAVDGGFITRMDNADAVPKKIISGLAKPRGVYCVGEGANLKLYIAADTVIWRANIGNNDTLTTSLELVASLGLYARDVIIDDGGGMMVTMRTGELVHPGYIERYDISSGLPKKRGDAVYSIETSVGLPACFGIKHGTDHNSASDDSIYFAVRRSTGADTTTFGIHQLTGIDGLFPDVKQIYKNSDNPLSLGGNNRQDADIAIDWAGNIIWFENGNEEIVMIATPRSGNEVTLTTKSADTISVSGSTSVERNNVNPNEFALHQNYPNPFNPSTIISYSLPTSGKVTIVVYDILGNVVNELFNGETQQGYNSIVWNAANTSGIKVASGMYLYRVTAQLSDGRSFADTKRMMLLK